MIRVSTNECPISVVSNMLKTGQTQEVRLIAWGKYNPVPAIVQNHLANEYSHLEYNDVPLLEQLKEYRNAIYFEYFEGCDVYRENEIPIPYELECLQEYNKPDTFEVHYEGGHTFKVIIELYVPVEVPAGLKVPEGETNPNDIERVMDAVENFNNRHNADQPELRVTITRL